MSCCVVMILERSRARSAVTPAHRPNATTPVLNPARNRAMVRPPLSMLKYKFASKATVTGDLEVRIIVSDWNYRVIYVSTGFGLANIFWDPICVLGEWPTTMKCR